jgi:hypothetical protein
MKTTPIAASLTAALLSPSYAKLADRSRLHKTRQLKRGTKQQRPIEGQNYRVNLKQDFKAEARALETKGVRGASSHESSAATAVDPFHRHLSSQLTGCCTTYISYSASDMCSLYNQDCVSGDQPSHDSGDQDCTQAGLSFIGISFSVNTALGNPYSYQLCDQFPMENIIDRNYDYVMGMDEDGWLVGGGYKSFDYSGKMP